MMRLLVISPDYLSHTLPLTQIGAAWAQPGGDVVVATGGATRRVVEAAGLGWVDLRLGAGHNDGVIAAAEQPAGEAERLQAFFDATRVGPVATLLYQADARRHDLMHDPDRVLDRLGEIMDAVRPDRVLVDHVAFGARLALLALGVDATTVVLGHPSALASPPEIYGLPPEWPAAIRPAAAELRELAERCRVSVDHMLEVSEEFLARRTGEVAAAPDLTATAGRPTIYVYPEALHDPDRPLPVERRFIGALTRQESLGDFELPTGTGPRVTVALGSFLSARSDVLAVAVEAARVGRWRLALAHGSSSPDAIGTPPAGAVVVRHLPQVALLEHTDVVIHHGGNGSVTEAATCGVPMVVLPFSTDQFAGAASVERAGIGEALAPNTLTVDALVDAVDRWADSAATAGCRSVARSIRTAGGPAAAVDAVLEQGLRPFRPRRRRAGSVDLRPPGPRSA